MSHPRTHPLEGELSTPVRQLYGSDIERPLLIVGNGPSASVPRYELLPDDPVVFRMNWFFLEERYYYGRVVDGFFYSIPNAELEYRLRTVLDERWYDVRTMFSPMRVAAGRDGESHRSILGSSGLTELDHWSVIAENPTLSRFMMSRPLPTQGVQVLATALQLGFRDITLCGVDMYESAVSRYGYVVPDAVASALQEKDLSPGYENSHSLDRDLDFLDACLAQYEDATIKHIGPSAHLGARLRPPPRGGRPCSFAGVAAPDVYERAKPTFRADGDNLTVELSDDLPFAIIEGRRCGFVTLVSGPFHHGARALARSLAKVSNVPLTVMCTPSADRERLRASGLVCVDVPEIRNPNRLSGATRRFAATYSKLHAFRMAHLERAVYVDSDMIVLQSIDDLFERSGFWAAPDHGLEFNYDRFNSGLFAFDPDPEVFETLVGRVHRTVSYDSGDQGFLNEVFHDWHRLPHEYNVNKRWSAHHPNLFHLESTRVIHFVGVKPWQPETPTPYDELYRLWFSFLSDQELLDVTEHLRTQPHENADALTSGWVHSLRRLVGRRRRGRTGDKPDWSSGTLLRRTQARHRDGAFADALELIQREWPGDSAATPGLHRELGKSLILNGRIDEGFRILHAAASRFPQSTTIRRNLNSARKAVRVKRLSAGLVPDQLLARAARRFAGTT